MRWMELRVPPVVVFLACVLLSWTVSSNWGLPWMPPLPVRLMLAGLPLLLSAVFALGALLAFRRARTTVNPLEPMAASRLVDQGVYRHSRNPMYLSLLLLLFSWSAWLGEPTALLGALLFVVWMNRFQILPEERALSRIFGERYDAYRTRVRRWL